MDLSGSGYGQVAGSCLRANEPLGSTKGNFVNTYRRIRFSIRRLLRGVTGIYTSHLILMLRHYSKA